MTQYQAAKIGDSKRGRLIWTTSEKDRKLSKWRSMSCGVPHTNTRPYPFQSSTDCHTLSKLLAFPYDGNSNRK